MLNTYSYWYPVVSSSRFQRRRVEAQSQGLSSTDGSAACYDQVTDNSARWDESFAAHTIHGSFLHDYIAAVYPRSVVSY